MPLAKAYEPHKYESDVYKLWEQSGAFAPKQGSGAYFSMVMPPPNANADLHIGQGLTFDVEDVVIRFQRMQGKSTVYLPGADHAGFETWVVYEKKLQEQGKSRFDFSREELYKQVWDFVELNKQNFQSQMRSLGVSCDWSRFTYTLDAKVIKQAYATFKKMWDEGLIYRGKRIVNYCTFHGTSFSDIEVVHEEEESQLWQIAYPLTDGAGEIVVATTRPESMLGDTAVAVHPDDKRYKKLIGKSVKLPLTGREVPIVADKYVDMAFGTGAVKVTPAHDPNDYEIAQRHDLPLIEVITPEGKTGENVPADFRNLNVEEARQKVAEALAKQGLIRGVEAYTHSVGKCYRCGTTIEPLAMEQWFINMQPLAKRAIEELKAKEITFYPDSKRTQLIRYLEGLKDWNISRQIAWGIPIPAFQSVNDPKDWVFDERVELEKIKIKGKNYRRDPDVFDTWFSSGHWPLVTLGYPDSPDFKKFYPTSLLETGGEILYQWVGRMIMLGLYLTGQVPFKDVYIHGYVMAEGGAKMSKSLGNVIDPIAIIKEYGSDALRMGLIAGRVAAVNRGYDRRRVEEARNFCNKLWNVARYIENLPKSGSAKPQTIADHWILDRLSIVFEKVEAEFKKYRLGEAYELIYHFVWDDLADWYIEAAKVQPNPSLARYVLEQTLKLAHPFAPFVTEAIWQAMDSDQDRMLISQTWDKLSDFDVKQARDFEGLKAGVEEIRRITAATGVSQPKLLHQNSKLIETNRELIVGLAKLSGVEASDRPSGLRLSSAETAWLALDDELVKQYLLKLSQQAQAAEAAAKRLEVRLRNKNYTSKAPKELVAETKSQLASAQAELKLLSNELTRYEKSLS